MSLKASSRNRNTCGIIPKAEPPPVYSRGASLFERRTPGAAYDNLGFWVSIEKSTDVPIGWFHLRPAKDASQGLELGYRIQRPAWNKGYASEGSHALMAMGFGIPGIKRIIARTMKANLPSLRVMEKLGMRFEGDFAEESFPGDDKAAVQYVITREEFESRK